MKKLILLFASVITLAACQGKTENQNTATTSTEIKVDSSTYYTKISSVNKEGDSVHTSFSVKFPQLVGGDEAVATKINAQIEQMVKDQTFSMEDTVQTTKTGSIESLAKGFVKEFEDLAAENNDMPLMGWDYEGSGDTLLISPKVISIYYQVYSFTGGAHGNSNITYLNFN
ncbi:MAG: DUF4163 domain-containing protein, partial [Emticicia sp.]|nr:DUF4163 domain-containing protein [Emticicia sp.]